MESEIVIRQMRCEDLDSVLEVEKSFTNPWSRLMFLMNCRIPVLIIWSLKFRAL